MRRLVWIALVLTAACSKSGGNKEPEKQPVETPTPEAQPRPCEAAEAKGGMAMRWIDDDFDVALACAKQTDRPIVLDLWAPWCHTCLSMQTTVFTDKSFAADADKFVFAALDTDRENNADAVEKYPTSAWPTFYVIAPDGGVLARFVGGASIAQFHAFLDGGLRAKAGGTEGADAHLLAAERHLQKHQLEDAARELRAALKDAPKDWPRRSDAQTSLISTLDKSGDTAGCLELADRWLAAGDGGNAASASDFLYYATDCANKRATDEPDRVKHLREAAVARWQKLLADPEAPLSVDDRSDAMANLRETLDTLGKKSEAKAVAEKQLALLDDTAAKAPTPLAAMTYNWPRAEVYTYLGKPLDLVPALQKSVKDLPKEYDPPARLGWIYLQGGKLDEAAKWTEKALTMVYGPRKIRLLTQRAEIAQKAGDQATERKYRALVVKTYETLPASQVSKEAVDKAKQALAALDDTKPGKHAPSTH